LLAGRGRSAGRSRGRRRSARHPHRAGHALRRHRQRLSAGGGAIIFATAFAAAGM